MGKNSCNRCLTSWTRQESARKPFACYASGVTSTRVPGTIVIPVLLLQTCLWGESCVPDLTAVLVYPPSVLTKRIQGNVESVVLLDTEANAVEIRSAGYPLLVESVERVLLSMKFGPGCPQGGVSLRINFQISDKIPPDSKTQINRLAESSYEVVAPAQPVEITISDPAWVITRRGRVLHRLQRAIARLRF